MITFRGHHLLCSLNYSGSGYTDEFIMNFDEICVRLTKGEPIKLSWKPDSICKGWLNHPDCHCHRVSIIIRDVFGFLSTSIALRRWCFPPRTITLTSRDVERLRKAFALNLTRAACVGCSWFNHCSRTAARGWPESKLMPVEKN